MIKVKSFVIFELKQSEEASDTILILSLILRCYNNNDDDNLCFVPTRQCKYMVLHETGSTSNIDKIVKSKNRCPVCQMEA